MERKVIVIVGPTCSGKTKIAIALAQRLNTEIISADSRQIYNLLSIGTAKPSRKELLQVKHHFIDYLNPDDNYNVSKFESDATKIINQLHREKKIPIVVGGSGLYIKAIIDGITDTVDADEEYRNELLLLREKFGNDFLYQKLQEVDPKSADKMLPQNWKRVIRALEVYHATGQPIWKLHKEQMRINPFIFYQFGLLWDRKALYKNIETRVDKMISNGFVDEVKNILESGYSPDLNSLNTVGYKEIISFLKNKITLERAVELIKRNTRHYAKRQLTWFRKDKRIEWISIGSNFNSDLIAAIIQKKIIES
jgi:tRNA dimethylallyltransferase